MAELLLVGDAIRPNAISAYLREALPHDFTVVAAPVVGHCALDAIVVGPGGLTLIAAEGSRAAALPPAEGDFSGPGQAGRAIRQFALQAFPQVGPRRVAVSHEQVATAATRTFLEDV